MFGFIVLVITLLLTAVYNQCHAQKTAWVVSIENSVEIQLHKPIQTDSLIQLVNVCFDNQIPCDYFLSENYFQITTGDIDFYGELKRVKKIRRNGKVVLRRIRVKHLNNN